MAVSRILIASLVLSLLLLHVVEAVEEANSHEMEMPRHCGKPCTERCHKAKKFRRCMRECGACCHKCNCVPYGTSGNENACPCYANWTSPDGKHKCP